MVASQLKAVPPSRLATSGMPLDKSPRAPRGQSGAKLTMPTVTKGSPYIAPRLAGSAASSPDLGRKAPATARLYTSTPKGDSPSPVKGSLSPNVTPRSGSRRYRAESASSTPIGTPVGTPTSSRPLSMVSGKAPSPDKYVSPTGIGIHCAGLYPSSRSGSAVGSGEATTYLRSTSPERGTPKQETPGSQSPATFFHASDAQFMAKAPTNPSSQPKVQPFFYANGELDAPPPLGEPNPRTAPQPQSKFFHANGLPSDDNIPATARQTPSPSTSRHSPKVASFPPPSRSATARSASPLRDFQTPPHHSQGVTDKASGAKPITTAASSRARPLSVESPLGATRRGSINSAVSTGQHKKAQSVSTFESLHAQQAPGTDANGRISDASSSFVSEPESLEHTVSESIIAPLISPTSPLVSPTHSTLSPATLDPSQQTKLEQVQALAAQARRERKVLDLEISNSSLLAINRTLEREMRKQKAELRRYRRLTSSGRISLAPLSTDSQPSYAETTSSGLSPIESSDEESYGSSEDDADDGSSSLSSPTSDSSASPNADSEAAARRRDRDAKRLRLDLARHRALLADSQALNQSLKRCLGRTEALISEGKRALEHKVRVSEVHLGGRVLDADEIGEDVELDERRHGLLSPGLNANGGGAQEYRWVEPMEEPAAGSPRTPFSGVVPFVRRDSVDTVVRQVTAAEEGRVGSPERRPSRSRSPERITTRSETATTPSLTLASSQAH